MPRWSACGLLTHPDCFADNKLLSCKPTSSDTPFCCLLYTSAAADELPCVDPGGRRLIKKKKNASLYEEKWLNILGTFVQDWFSYESHVVHGKDSLVDLFK